MEESLARVGTRLGIPLGGPEAADDVVAVILLPRHVHVTETKQVIYRVRQQVIKYVL